jgi:hypothetical protein
VTRRIKRRTRRMFICHLNPLFLENLNRTGEGGAVAILVACYHGPISK